MINRLPFFFSELPDHQIILDEDEKDSSLHNKLSLNPLRQQLHLQNLIHQVIFSVIQQKSDWISNHLCETVQPGCQTSHWFA